MAKYVSAEDFDTPEELDKALGNARKEAIRDAERKMMHEDEAYDRKKDKEIEEHFRKET